MSLCTRDLSVQTFSLLLKRSSEGKPCQAIRSKAFVQKARADAQVLSAREASNTTNFRYQLAAELRAAHEEDTYLSARGHGVVAVEGRVADQHLVHDCS